MSIIVHGPQGCGKTKHGEALRRHFKLDRVVEEDEVDSLCGRLYDPRHAERIKSLNWLILTSDPPPAALAYNRRIMSFEAAMAAAGLHAQQG